MHIRRATEKDLPQLADIYRAAKAIMRQSGNVAQWTDEYPNESVLKADIHAQQLYVVMDETQQMCGAFAYIVGIDPTYLQIEGNWLNQAPYATLHRVASNGQQSGVLRHILQFAEKRIANVRIDTHEANAIMRHLLTKYGYTYCGIIHLQNGEPRLAYQKAMKE